MPKPEGVLTLACSALWALSTGLISAQQVARPADFEYTEGLTSVIGVRELADGKLIIADASEARLLLVDPRNGSGRAISRVGGGPTEFGSMSAVLARPADTTWIVDPLQRRVLVINPDGTPNRTVRVPDTYSLTPMAVDSAGGVYDRRAQGPAQMLVRRFAGLDAAPDTVGTLDRTGGPMSVPSATGSTTIRYTSPFPAQDEWAVAPDGSLVIARHTNYRLDVIRVDGATTAGPELAFQAHPISRAEREEALRRYRQLAARLPAGAGVPEPDIPGHKYPFTGAIHVTQTGEVWIPLTPSIEGGRILYDVIGPDQRRRAQVLMPEGTRVLGFGRGVVFTLRTDAFGLQYVQRRPL